MVSVHAAFLAVLPVLALAACLFRPRRTRVRTAYDSASARQAAIVAATPSLSRYRAPRALFFGGSVHTVLASVRRRRPALKCEYDRELFVQALDGGTNALDWLRPRGGGGARGRPGAPVLVILHGMVGGSQERYAQHAARAFLDAFEAEGGAAVVFTARGCSQSPVTSAQVFCAADTSDFRAVVAALRARLGPDSPIFSCGFSLGGCLLSKYVCEEGRRCGLAAAVACAAPFDLSASARMLEQEAIGYRFWNRLVLGPSLVNYVRRNRRALEAAVAARPIAKTPHPSEGQFAAPRTATSPRKELRREMDIEACLRGKTCRDYDNAIVAPAFGYADAEAYYRDAATTRRFQSEVAIDFLVLHAKDDPVAGSAFLPPEEAFTRAGSRSILAMTDEGGHLGWCKEEDMLGPPWESQVIVEYCSAILAQRRADQQGRGAESGARARR
jgi:hypothetical protein